MWDFWSGVNKKPLVCPFQDRQFQNPDRLQTVSEIFTCDRQIWTKQMWKNMCWSPFTFHKLWCQGNKSLTHTWVSFILKAQYESMMFFNIAWKMLTLCFCYETVWKVDAGTVSDFFGQIFTPVGISAMVRDPLMNWEQWHCTMRSLYSISISQPNKLGPILKVAQCDII